MLHKVFTQGEESNNNPMIDIGQTQRLSNLLDWIYWVLGKLFSLGEEDRDAIKCLWGKDGNLEDEKIYLAQI
jgi:hypothetical protein